MTTKDTIVIRVRKCDADAMLKYREPYESWWHSSTKRYQTHAYALQRLLQKAEDLQKKVTCADQQKLQTVDP